MNNKINLHIGRKRTVLFEKYNKTIEMELLFFKYLNGCVIKSHKFFPNSVFFLKNDIVLFEQNKETKIFWINYDKTLLKICNKYNLGYSVIMNLTRISLKKTKFREFEIGISLGIINPF